MGNNISIFTVMLIVISSLTAPNITTVYRLFYIVRSITIFVVRAAQILSPFSDDDEK